MKLVCKIAYLALFMNTLPGIGQERVFYKTVQVNGLNIFYREAGPANGPVILVLQFRLPHTLQTKHPTMKAFIVYDDATSAASTLEDSDGKLMISNQQRALILQRGVSKYEE